MPQKTSEAKANNVPAELEDKFKSCKDQVMADGESEESAYAICYTSVVEGKSLEDARAEHAKARTPKRKGPNHKVARRCKSGDCDYCNQFTPMALPTSLTGLQESRLAQEQANAIQSLAYDFQDVTAGIMQSDDIPDKAQAIAAEVGIFQQMLNDLSSGLKSLAAKWGARHSRADNDAIQSVHDMSVQLGAMCAGKAKSAFGVCKGRDGQYYGLGVFTNCYEDLDGEIITDAAHKEFAAYLDANPSQAPELWTWHEPGTARKSRANLWDYDGTFFWMQWPLTEHEAKALALVGPLTMSHQFNGIKQGKDWVQYRSFEASVLSPSAEANPFTSFETVAKESSMFTPEKRALFVALHGEEFTKEKEQASDKARKEVDALGVARKESKADPAMTTPDTSNPTSLVTQCISMCQECATLCDGLESPEAATCATACRDCSQACAALLGIGVKEKQPDTIPTKPALDALVTLTESVKALSVQLQSLDARVVALSQAKTKEVERQAEIETEKRMSWLTSPRAPTAGIADIAKARGGQMTPEQLAAMGSMDNPMTAWTKEIQRKTR